MFSSIRFTNSATRCFLFTTTKLENENRRSQPSEEEDPDSSSVLHGNEVFVKKLLSRSTSSIHSRGRDSDSYTSTLSGAVPFIWELQPGIPKDPPNEEQNPSSAPPLESPLRLKGSSSKSRIMKEMNRKMSGINWDDGNIAIDKTGSWTPPIEGWVKINVDGAYSSVSQRVGCGGVIRDHEGKFLYGFIHNMPNGDHLSAEVWACLLGLKASWDLGFRRAFLESDSSEVVRVLHGGDIDLHPERDIISEVRGMMKRDWEVEIHCISRIANGVADYLAKCSLSALPGYHAFVSPVNELSGILNKDFCKPL